MKDTQKDAAAKKAASKSGAAATDSTGTQQPEPKDTSNPTAPAPEGSTGVADAAEVEKQREQEAKAQTKAAEAAGDGGAATPAQKGQQTRAASDVVDQAKADAEARAQAEADAHEQAEPEAVDNEDPVQKQRREEAEAVAQAKADADAAISDEDRLLLAAAPGGQRTALTGGKEGSTVVTHTAANPRPASGPLDAPVTGIENYAATEDDPDNRVYADEAGPRPVMEDPERENRYIDEDGNDLTFEEMFEDVPNKTYVTPRVRVYETFIFPNTTVEGRRLAFIPGKRIPRGQAENVRAMLEGPAGE